MSIKRTVSALSQGRYVILVFAAALSAFFFILAVEPPADGPPFVIESGADRPAVSMDREGRLAMAWVGLSPRAARAQRFDRFGNALGPAFQVNAGNNHYPWEDAGTDLALTAGGAMTVAWGTNGRCYGRRFDGNGIPLTEDFVVGYQGLGWDMTPGVGGAASGRFVVGRINGYFAEYPGDPEADAFGPEGEAGPQKQSLHLGPYGYERADAGIDDAGNFVLVWRYWKTGLRQRLYDPAGTLKKDDVIDQAGVNGRVSMAPDGQYLVVWTAGFPSSSIKAQRYDAAGNPLGTELVIDSAPHFCGTPGGQEDPNQLAVAQDASGRFTAVYTKNVNGTCGVYAQRFLAGGTPDGSAVRVDLAGSPGEFVDVAADGDGNFTVVWQESQTVMARRFCGPLGATDPAPLTVCEGQAASFATMAQGRDPFGYSWNRDGIALADEGSITGSRSNTLLIDPVVRTDAGMYACNVDDACASPGSVSTASAALTVLPAVRAQVTDLMLTRNEAAVGLHFGWIDVADALDYVVRESEIPNGSFETITGVAESGTTGLDVFMLGGNRFYLVHGRNGCGEGP